MEKEQIAFLIAVHSLKVEMIIDRVEFISVILRRVFDRFEFISVILRCVVCHVHVSNAQIVADPAQVTHDFHDILLHFFVCRSIGLSG